MFENTIRRMPRPQDVATLTTQQLRKGFVVTSLFRPDELRGVFTDLDRLVVGGVMSLQPVALPNHPETGRAFFPERREPGSSTSAGRAPFMPTAKRFRLSSGIAFICRRGRNPPLSKAGMPKTRRNFIS